MLRHIIIPFKIKALRNGKRWSRIGITLKYWKSLYEDINNFNFGIKVTLLYRIIIGLLLESILVWFWDS